MFKTLTRKLKIKKPTPPASIDGVRVVPNMRARRIALRLDQRHGDIVLTWPRRCNLQAAQRFIRENRQWIAEQRAKLPPAREFEHGMRIRIAGEAYTITHKEGRGLTRIEGNRLIVHGAVEHLNRRVRDFLKEEAYRLMSALADKKAAKLGLRPSSVRILDPKSRWGSCGPDGKLMFSWRLILAPYAVMDYLVAHEVAHRVHMNHGPAFWRLCASLTTNAKASRHWLNEHGKTLMAWK
jgi:predicted metal-dependent hydrolase